MTRHDAGFSVLQRLHRPADNLPLLLSLMASKLTFWAQLIGRRSSGPTSLTEFNGQQGP
jgi:hypothetical protein